MTRQKQIIRTGYLGILTNVVVAAVKALTGLASGSMAILLDAVNNLTDAISSALTIAGVKLAALPPNDKHPFGYGRIEYFTAVIIAALILVAGCTSLVESVKGIITPEVQEYSVVGLCIIAGSVVVKTVLGIYTRRKGKALSSDSLVSSGTESILDGVVSVTTIVSAIIMMTTGWSVDSWLAAIIACLIIKTGIEMLVSPVNELLGRSVDRELSGEIKARVAKVDGVRGVYDVVLHNYGPQQHIGALHVEVDEQLSAADLHSISRTIQHMLHKDMGLVMTVGFYAHHHEGSDEARIEQKVREYVTGLAGVTGMHGFYISHKEKMISFDIVYSFKMRHPLTLRKEVAHWLKEQYPDYYLSIGLDRNFSE